ncbi:MAG: encapsulin-associated ferritin-like protein [Kosmotogaceae bacterium]
MYHEDLNELSEKAKDISRALNSLKEEIEAVDWYNQRADVTKDEAIKAILEHNRDEEIEHAAMIIEWLRRNMEAWDDELKTYLFTEGSLTEIEESGESEGSSNDLGLSKK